MKATTQRNKTLTSKQQKLQRLLDEVSTLIECSLEDWSVKGTYLEKVPLEKRAALHGAIELLSQACPQELGGFELTFRKVEDCIMHIQVNNK